MIRSSIAESPNLPVAAIITLVLVTYHFGDEAGQGFVHGLAGIVLFVMALGLLILLDSLFNMITRLRTVPK